jgi:hypothetical protein
MSEDLRSLIVGGLVGGEGVVQILGRDLPYSEEEVSQRFDAIQFMQAVGCFQCVVMTELRKKPKLDIQAVLGSKDRTLIEVVCPGAVDMIKAHRQVELQCHVPKEIQLVFNRE